MRICKCNPRKRKYPKNHGRYRTGKQKDRNIHKKNLKNRKTLRGWLAMCGLVGGCGIQMTMLEVVVICTMSM